MLSRWFVNDASNTGTWRLKGHARRDFWRWIKSWSVVASCPGDLGDNSTVYDLPPLTINESIVDVDFAETEGDLFGGSNISATGIRQEKKQSFDARIDRVFELSSGDDYCIVWADTNDESERAAKIIPGAVEVTGSMKLEEKEAVLSAFSRGDERVLVTKPSIAGFGLNWQHCNNMVFAGANYSYEKF